MLRKSIPVFNSISPSNIDVANGVIKNVVIINSGEDKLGDNIDSTFLQQIFEQGNSQSQGVKCRFGHPAMCDDALGSYIGRYKNFQVNGTSVTADLFLDATSKISPKGNLHDYILEFAQKNDDMFGNSIVFRQGSSEFKTVKEADGTVIDKEFIRLESFVASDLVDSPAATNSLFKSDDDFAAKATDFLNENEEIFERIVKNPKVLTEFLTKYSNYKSQKSLTMKDESKSETLLSKMSKDLKELKDKIFGKPEVTKGTLEVTTADGTTLKIEDGDDSGKPEVGDPCSNPDGSYVMPDGGSIMVADGKISEITSQKAPEEPAAPVEPMMSNDEIVAMKAANEKLTADLKEKSEALAALENKVGDIEKQFTDFKSTIASKYKPEVTATVSSKEAKDKLAGKEPEENRFTKEAREERRSQYKGKAKIPNSTFVN